MQTFVPYPDINLSVKVLDSKRLGKQRVEARQIINDLVWGNHTRWSNHPAILMWKGYEEALILYYNACVNEWVRRGFNNTMELEDYAEDDVTFPWWWGKYEVHLSHQSNLLRKDEDYYRRFFPDIEDNWLYAWPGPTPDHGMRVVIPKWAKDKEYINPLDDD